METIEYRNKRAGVACLHCRSRKVKCDVQVRGTPCRNCILDAAHCRVQTSKRGRPAKVRPDHSHLLTASLLPGDSSSRGTARVTHTVEWLPRYAWTNSGEVAEDHPSVSSESSHDQSPRTDVLIEDILHSELSYATLIDRSDLQLSKRFAGTQSQSIALPLPTQADRLPREEANSDLLPAFIQPLSKSLDAADIDYLRRKGALQIPDPDLRNEILTCYIQYIHPQLPVLDVSTLRHILIATSSPDIAPMSMLLFQAVMFSGIHLIDNPSKEKTGYDTPDELRKAFYMRARLLYDLEVESDRKSIIQSLVLMAYMSETPGDMRGGWHWIGIAINLAMTLGLHRKADYAGLAPEDCRLRRRIWWSCYIRDRVLALAMNRPLRIRDEEFDTPMLTMDDFETDIYGSAPVEAVDGSPVPVDTATAEEHARMSISLAKLCTGIGEILHLHYSMLPEEGAPSTLHDQTGHTSTLFFARNGVRQVESIHRCDQRLQEWFRDRPSTCVYSTVGQRSFVFHRAFLNLVYFSMVSTLHRPLLRPSALGDFAEYRMLSERRVQNAALEVCRMSHDMRTLGLARFYPGAGSLLQLPAVIILLRELRSPHGRRAEEVFPSILSCINVVEDIRERQIGGQIAMFLGYDLLRRANIAVQWDKQTSRAVGLCYRDGISLSPSSCLQRNGPHGATKVDLLQASAAGEATSASSGLEVGPEQQTFTLECDHAVGGPQNERSIPQPGVREGLYPAADADFDAIFGGFANWNTLSISDDWWTQSPNPDVTMDGSF